MNGALNAAITVLLSAAPVARTLQLALHNKRFAKHRRIVRITYPVWLYVALTRLVIHWMNSFVRPMS